MPALPPELVRTLRREDLEGSPDWVEPLLRYLNLAVNGLANSIDGLDLGNTEIVTAQLTHNTAQLLSLKKLKRASIIVSAHAGMTEAGVQHTFANPPLLEQTNSNQPGQVRVTAKFVDTTATRVNCKLILL